MRLIAILSILFLVLGGLGAAPRETGADAGAIAAGVAVMAAGAGVSYGGCVAMRAAAKPDISPVTPPESAELH